jgi:hypothetical protein
MRVLKATAMLAFLACSNVYAQPQRNLEIDCSPPSRHCPLVTIIGDSASSTRSFSGFADPAIVADPSVPERLWMAYSYLEGKPARGANGRPVGVPHVSTHLARSDNGGASWRFERVLWDSELAEDPERRGPQSYFGSETPSLAVLREEGRTTWFSVRLSYFLEPVTAYEPRYVTGWTMRVARATGASPAALAGATETVLGVRTTAAAYGANVDLNALSPHLGDCAMWNNPVIAIEGARLFLVAECLAFNGAELNLDRTRMIVLSTEPSGQPEAWRWRYDGVLADRALAQALGGERLVSATIARGADNSLLFIATPQIGSSMVGHGCVVMELDSLAPPRVRRDSASAPIIRARQTSRADRRFRTGACTYHPASATGMLTVAADTRRGLRSALRATGLRP